MYLRYGSWTSQQSECDVTITRTPKRNNQRRIGFTERWNIQGWLQHDTSAGLYALLTERKDAFAVDGGGIALLHDDYSVTNHILDSTACLGGIRIVEEPSFPQRHPTEYADTGSFRVWTAAVEGDLIDQSYNHILSYYESLAHEGEGGPRRVFLEAQYGPPQPQAVSLATTYRVVQEGECVAMFTYPPPNPPIWPLDRHYERTRFWKRTPKLSGPPGQPAYTEWTQGWHYEFEAINPFIGLPILQQG